ncbi:DUF31 family protein [Mycoplasma zalophidermidis]|uniref:Ig-specific serine endopeptidase MIP n=1 Tax=Mycoplasma zalophidermidis TaxID=398174 RepID=UPI001C10990D|nr:DUF31 family protein [Mycoplasma zalophidermidis]MBU4689449.1 DUF31 family protein [Mycoplasma zalophidermidis]
MKKNKLILLTNCGLHILPFVAISASCKNNDDAKKENQPDKKVDDAKNSKINNDSGKKDVLGSEGLNSVRQLSFNQLFDLQIEEFGVTKSKNSFTPQTIQKRYEELIKLSLKDSYKNRINVKITTVSTDWDANLTGKLKISVLLSDVNNPNLSEIRTFELDGFKISPNGTNDDGTFPSDPKQNGFSDSDFDKYVKASQLERWKIDNADYMQGIKTQYHNQSVDQIRPELNYTPESAKKFNSIAKDVNINTYEDAAYKGHTLPKLKADGSFDGLSIYPKSAPAKHSKVDFLGGRDVYQSIGLARLLPNEFYKQIGLETLAVGFNYAETFAEEIAKAKQNIELIKKWKTNKETIRLQEYIKAATDQKETEKNILKYDEERELNRAAEQDKPAIKNDFAAKYKKIDDEINKIKSYTFDDLLKIFEDELKGYEDELKHNRKSRGANGTMWIMDYEIPNNGGYPTKWYFGTNSHVAKLMSSSTFNGFNVTVLSPQTGVKSLLRLTGLDDRFTNFNFGGNNIGEAVKKVYDATDYLNTSPSQYLTTSDKEKYKDVEEMIDFAVIEVDFKKLVNLQSSVIRNTKPVLDNSVLANSDAQKLAKLITNDYYSRSDDKKTKFLSKSYLLNYQNIDFPIAKRKGDAKTTDELFALGYPMAREDFFLRRYYDDDQIKWKETYQSLWTNSDYRFYSGTNVSEGGQPNFPEERYKRGNYLSYQVGYRSFIDKPGLNDGFIVSPIRGKEIYKTYSDDKTTLKSYFNTGLQYMLRHFVPIGGSSGSSVRNQNNELVGVHSTIIPSAKTDFVAAFRSEGYDYKGAYGDYNLPQYDLIYGGGKDQKTSYLDSLIKIYGENGLKTWLFKKGISKKNVPSEFLFNQNQNKEKHNV